MQNDKNVLAFKKLITLLIKLKKEAQNIHKYSLNLENQLDNMLDTLILCQDEDISKLTTDKLKYLQSDLTNINIPLGGIIANADILQDFEYKIEDTIKDMIRIAYPDNPSMRHLKTYNMRKSECKFG